jgi:hypothetical protein
MRILVTIAHYFKIEPGHDWYGALGSGRAPLAKIAALNSEIVSLHRYLGRRSAVSDANLRAFDTTEAHTLDIVIVTMRDANVLEWIGIDPATYSVEYFDGPPLMLAFEAQRIMRERAGNYDLYAYLEDDLTVVDPDFFAKILWFVESFGPGATLFPTRYEMAHSGTPAKIEFSPHLSSKAIAPFQRPGLAPALTGRWHGREQTFRPPNNPHSGCFFVTDAQLKRWIEHPSFYDRDTSFCDPLASAATYAPGRVFGIYKPAEPDPWFLAIEHYGTRYAAGAAPAGETYGEPPLLALAEAANADGGGASPLGGLANSRQTVNTVTAEAAKLKYQLQRLTRSRTALTKALAAAIWNKWTQRD